MIDALTKYLDTYYDDHEAWLELCDVYLSKHMYDQAAYCCEEIILLQPSNHICYLKYAETLYTLNHLPLAFKHYCKVLELCTDNVRALYGLELVKTRFVKYLLSITHILLLTLVCIQIIRIYRSQSCSRYPCFSNRTFIGSL